MGGLLSQESSGGLNPCAPGALLSLTVRGAPRQRAQDGPPALRGGVCREQDRTAHPVGSTRGDGGHSPLGTGVSPHCLGCWQEKGKNQDPAGSGGCPAPHIQRRYVQIRTAHTHRFVHTCAHYTIHTYTQNIDAHTQYVTYAHVHTHVYTVHVDTHMHTYTHKTHAYTQYIIYTRVCTLAQICTQCTQHIHMHMYTQYTHTSYTHMCTHLHTYIHNAHSTYMYTHIHNTKHTHTYICAHVHAVHTRTCTHNSHAYIQYVIYTHVHTLAHTRDKGGQRPLCVWDGSSTPPPPALGFL